MESLPHFQLSNMLRVFLIDRHSLVRSGVKRIIQDVEGIDVVGEADYVDNALAKLRIDRPDVVLLDVPERTDGVEGDIKRIRDNSPRTSVVCLTGSLEPNIHDHLIRSGAGGIVLTYETEETLVEALKTVHQGEVWINRSLGTTLSKARRSQILDSGAFRIATLTPYEKKIIRLIGRGYTNQRIADELGIAEKTVRNNLTIIYSKLRLTTRLELAIFASERAIHSS